MQPGALGAQVGEVLGKRDEIRSVPGGPADESLGAGHVALDVGPRGHLDRRHPERPAAGFSGQKGSLLGPAPSYYRGLVDNARGRKGFSGRC